jgi:hypothetical protein
MKKSGQGGARRAGRKSYGVPKGETVVHLGIEGAIAGAALGSFAGPVGVIAGTTFGGLMGAVADEVLAEERHRAEAHDAELDETIGVIDGAIGAAPPGLPPARFGAYSAGSSGATESHGTTSEGPIQDLDE